VSIVQKVAEWIAARPEGAISADVAAAFSLTVSEASRVMGAVQREERFTTRVEYSCLAGANGRGRHTRRLFVDEVLGPQWRKTPVIGICGQQVVRFASICDAERVGGFARFGITRCLNGQQVSHAGYRWRIDAPADDANRG